MKKIKWGILATGNIANTFAKAANYVEGAELLAVGSRNKESADAFAREYAIPRVYGSYEELAADADIDAIYIASPHSHHFEHIELCLNHGKHVMCEKILTVNSALAQKIFDLAKAKNLLLMEAFWTRFLPATLKAHELIAAGTIGEINAIHTSFGQDLLHLGRESRVFKKELAGGVLLDMGVYVINSATMLLGNHPDRVSCTAVMGDTDVDIKTAINLWYGDKLASLTTCFNAWYSNETHICGSKGRIVLVDFWKVETIKVIPNGQAPYEISLPHACNGFEYEIEHFNACLAAGKTQSDVMSPADSLSIVGITDICRKQIGLVYPFE